MSVIGAKHISGKKESDEVYVMLNLDQKYQVCPFNPYHVCPYTPYLLIPRMSFYSLPIPRMLFYSLPVPRMSFQSLLLPRMSFYSLPMYQICPSTPCTLNPTHPF